MVIVYGVGKDCTNTGAGIEDTTEGQAGETCGEIAYPLNGSCPLRRRVELRP